MPGIYVRTPSQLDWFDQEKESLLTIPGSYWLCHKKNIYKFIFRYHRTMRNTIQFSYGRELLKIIRKIIKCHPTQGQQFGTQHLLVTYNCTSWTRQDKMFAIMKFQQRTNAAAFSHAFVLTVRIFSSLEHSLFDLKYPIVKEADAGTTFKDLNTPLDTEEKVINTVISATDNASLKKTAICQNKEMDEISKCNAIADILNEALKTTIDSFQDDGINPAIFHENLDKTIGNGTITTDVHHVDKHNTEFHKNVQESKSIDCSTEGCEKNIEQCLIDYVEEQSLRAKKVDEMETEKTYEIKDKTETELVIQKQNQYTRDIQKHRISSSLKPFIEITDCVNDRLSTKELNFDEKKKDNICTIDSKKNSLNDDKETINEYIECNDVPMCQRSVKKKMEDEPNLIIDQAIQENLQPALKNTNKDCVSKTIKENDKSIHAKQKEIYNEITNVEFQENDRQQARTSMNIIDKQSEDNAHNSKSYKIRKQKSRESEKKTVPDKVLRSSDITDLVMEGLMFTIRQDQDSVAVIEQKTKLEMDEVLENSEKVETKAGEKCLLNLSLLRLENLVTMIDSPRNQDEQHKNRHIINTSLSSFNAFPSDIVHNVNINHVNMGMNELSVSNYDRHNAMNHLSPYQSQWQHQCVSSNIKNNSDNYSAGISIEKGEQLMEWQNSDDEEDEEYKTNTEMRKQEGNITEISSSKKINTELQDTNSLIGNIEKIDKWTEGHNSLLTYSLLDSSRVSTKSTSVVSKESSLFKLPQQEANVPRIVSDKAITIEPSTLRKVLRHTCRARRFSSTTSNKMLQQDEQKRDTLTEDTTSEMDVSLDECMDSNIANSSLPIKFTIDSEKVKSNVKKSCAIDEDASEINRDVRVKNSKGKGETHRILRRSSSSKHGSSRKLQDITEEFYYDLLHVHNKDNAIRQRCLRQKQRSLNNLEDIKNGGKVRIEMLKFIQDITEGAKVVVRRLNIDNKSNLLEKSSNLI